MEINTQNKTKNYDDVDIKCPYCFQTFHHNEVGFRVDSVTDEEERAFKQKIMSGSETQQAENKNKLEIAKKYKKKKDEVWHRYWGKMGWVDNGNLFENGDGYDEYYDARQSALSENQDPVFTESNSEIERLYEDSDGFVYGALDERGKTTERRVCPYCHNKLPKDYGKNAVKFIAIVGISGAGKTVMISQLIDNIEDYATRVGGKITFDEGDSARKFTLQYKVRSNMQLPAGTREHFAPPIFLQFSRTQNSNFDKTTLVIYDIAGESCIKADGLAKFGPFVRNSDGIILLLDPRQISAFSCADENAEKPTAVLNAMGKAFLLDKNEKCKVPIAVAYSKSDKLQNAVAGINSNSHIFKSIEYDSRRGFMIDSYKNVRHEVETLLKKHSQTLYTNIKDIFENYGFFAFSSLGNDTETKSTSDGDVSILTRNLEPKRLEEPLLWLLYKWDMIEGISMRDDSKKRKGFFSFFRRK